MFLRKSSSHLHLFTLSIASSLLLTLVLKSLIIGVSTEIKASNLDAYEDNEFAEFEEHDDDQEPIVKAKVAGQETGMFNQGKFTRPLRKNVKDSLSRVGFGLQFGVVISIYISTWLRNLFNRKFNFSDKDRSATKAANQVDDEDEATVDEDDEADIFEDSEEFETSDSIPVKGSSAKKSDKIEITKVPIHLRTSWESYYVEGIMMLGLIIYFVNFFAGRNKNQAIAEMWLETHRDILDSNFALVGDDGKKDSANRGFIKETENVFLLWCSGRTCVEGMLTELRLLKRQDLVSNLIRIASPSYDEIVSHYSCLVLSNLNLFRSSWKYT